MAQKSITELLDEFQGKLTEVSKQLSEAERQAITLEADINNLKKEDKKLREQCEKLTGCKYDETNQVLQKKIEELTGILSDFDDVNCDINTMTETDVQKIEGIVNKYKLAEG